MAVAIRKPAAYIGTPEAASLLGVDVGTLRLWQLRYGFPTPSAGMPGQRRRVSRHEILTLRNALRTERSIPAAIEQARETNVRRVLEL